MTTMRTMGVAGRGMALALVLAGCSERDDDASTGSGDGRSGALAVHVVNYPLGYFTERIGGPEVEVTFPAPDDVDPAFWSPSAEQIRGYQSADLIVLNGASYAKWAAAAALPVSRAVDTSASFRDAYIPLAGQGSHSHGAEGEHEHGDVAFTTWLDPRQAVAQARAVCDALGRLRPDRAAEFRQRFEVLAGELQALDAELAAAFQAAGPGPLVFSHPVYQYLIRRYGLDGHAVHWEPGEAPTPEQWTALDEILKEHPAAWMVWEGEPLPESVAGLKERGLGSVVFAPCGNRPASGDYLDVMRENVRQLAGLAVRTPE